MANPVPLFHFYISKGSDYYQELPTMLYTDTMQPVNFVTDHAGGWDARCEVRDSAGNLITRFHSDPSKGWPGEINLRADGITGLYLSSTQTSLLTVTPTRGDLLICDVEYIDPADLSVWRMFQGKGRITGEVTTNG